MAFDTDELANFEIFLFFLDTSLMLSRLSGLGLYGQPDVSLSHGCRLAIIDWSVMYLFPYHTILLGCVWLATWNSVTDVASQSQAIKRLIFLHNN